MDSACIFFGLAVYPADSGGAFRLLEGWRIVRARANQLSQQVWHFILSLRFVLPGVGFATPGRKAVVQSPTGPKVYLLPRAEGRKAVACSRFLDPKSAERLWHAVALWTQSLPGAAALAGLCALLSLPNMSLSRFPTCLCAAAMLAMLPLLCRHPPFERA